jgi:hypothetical protein
MVEGTDTGWLSVLEKNGLGPATYNDDQKSSYTDYIEVSMQSQFNKRGL